MKRIILTAVLVGVALSGWSPRITAGQSVDLNRYLPDGDGLVVVDAQRLFSSEVWKLIAGQGAIENINNELSKVGADLSDLHSISMVLPSSGGPDIALAVSGNFDRNSVLEQLRARPGTLHAEQYKNHEVFTLSAGQEPSPSDWSYVFYEGGVLVAGSPASVRASVDAVLGERPSVSGNTVLNSALDEAGIAAVRFALTISPGLSGTLESSNLPLPDMSTVRLVFGGVDFTNSIDVNAILRNENPDQARAMTDQLNGIISLLKGLLASAGDPKVAELVGALETLSITGNEADVKISLKVPGEALMQALK